MGWNYDTHLMCDRCGKQPFVTIKPPLRRAKQLQIARVRGWLFYREGPDEFHFCPGCRKD
jgi:hypothetical protein